MSTESTRGDAGADRSGPTEHISVDGYDFAYSVAGEGEPVLLVHAGVLADFFTPLAHHPALTDRYQVINYHRLGYGFTSRPRVLDDARLPGHAAHVGGLLTALGIDSAHVVGHSSGGLVATRFAVDNPDRVRSLSLFEPVVHEVPSGAEQGRTVVRPALEAFAAGDNRAAVDIFLRGVCGPGYRDPEIVDRLPAGAFDRAEVDAASFFGAEAPSVVDWRWSALDVDRMPEKMFLLLGGDTAAVAPSLGEGHEFLERLFPRVKTTVVPGVTHSLQTQDPDAVAQALAQFLRG